MTATTLRTETLVMDTVYAALNSVLGLYLEHHIETVFFTHRLAYVFMDEDTPMANGKPTEVFVCKCQEGFERRKYNEHLKTKLKEVN